MAETQKTAIQKIHESNPEKYEWLARLAIPIGLVGAGIFLADMPIRLTYAIAGVLLYMFGYVGVIRCFYHRLHRELIEEIGDLRREVNELKTRP